MNYYNIFFNSSKRFKIKNERERERQSSIFFRKRLYLIETRWRTPKELNVIELCLITAYFCPMVTVF